MHTHTQQQQHSPVEYTLLLSVSRNMGFQLPLILSCVYMSILAHTNDYSYTCVRVRKYEKNDKLLNQNLRIIFWFAFFICLYGCNAPQFSTIYFTIFTSLFIFGSILNFTHTHTLGSTATTATTKKQVFSYLEKYRLCFPCLTVLLQYISLLNVVHFQQ